MNKQKLFFTTVFLIVLIASLPLASAYTLSYDANGNLITGDGKFRIYNGFNKLVQVREGDNATAPILENYTWHPMEDRIFAKSVYQNGSWQETVYYITKSFVRVENASGTYDYKYIYQNGQLVAQQNPDGSKLFMHNDNLGSVGLVTNESGTKVEETFYEPFGKIISGGESSRYDYTGKEYDSITGDYDFNARRYNPSRITLNTPDNGIKETYNPQNLNRYSYVLNNPYRYTDPTGKYEEDVHRDLTRFLAVGVGYSEGEADTIANADQAMDEGTKASYYHLGGKYHFETREYSEEQIREAIRLTDLELLGNAMHMYQDTYSHVKLNTFTHAISGHTPDKTYNDPLTADRMARSSFEELATSKGLSREQTIAKWYDYGYASVNSFNRATTSEEKAKALSGGSSGTLITGGKIIAEGTAIKKTDGGFQWTTVVVRSLPRTSGARKLS